MRTRTFVVSAVVAALLAPAASAGVIRGTLKFRSPTKPASARSSADRTASRSVTEAVIYVEAVPSGVEQRMGSTRRFLFFRSPKPAEIVNVVQRRDFDPRVAAVSRGAHVAFLNLDRVYHNVFSVSASRRFDLGKNAPGSRDTVVFNSPGVVNLHCDIHPDELGYLVVAPNRVYTRPDALGRWHLPKLPAGNYTVRMFHPTRGELKREVVMPAHGDVTLEMVR